jgi:antitoxin (DNA-binding transcriptional repressor) of toxin-antitoxin stability system
MRRITVHRARERFTALLREVERGQAFAIERNGTVVAHLVPARTPPFRALPPHTGALPTSELAPPDPGSTTDRVMGFDEGTVAVSPDFDAPLPAEVLDAFEVGEPE